MNYRDYTDKLITARVGVDQALKDKNLRIPDAFQSDVSEILRIYQDTHELWEWKITVGCGVCLYYPGDRHDTVIRIFLAKYPFLSGMMMRTSGGLLLGREQTGVSYDTGISLLLKHAHKKVDELYASLPERPASSANVKERLRDLRELLDKHLITPKEYDQKRSEILKGL
jgi:hypothetical protein